MNRYFFLIFLLVEKENAAGSRKSFDARDKWGDCIRPVRDQGHCGGCWAFAITGVLSDRLCIHSKGQIKVDLSPEHLISCASVMTDGCNGLPGTAFGVGMFAYFTYLNTWKKFRIVTEQCYPYTSGLAKFIGSEFRNTTKGCLLRNGNCPGGDSSRKPEYYNIQPNSVASIYNDVEQIKNEIMENGPVITSIRIFGNYHDYKGGVYVHGGGMHIHTMHMLKLIGWGHDETSGLDYWLCQNSYGTGWAENGFLRVGFGEGLLEFNVFTFMPQFN